MHNRQSPGAVLANFIRLFAITSEGQLPRRQINADPSSSRLAAVGDAR